ncbi:MAG: peroxiredoxin [Thiohalobacteraceae bacterium]
MSLGTGLALAALVVLVGVLWVRGDARAERLVVGMDAPDFALPDAQGTQRRLADFRGAWLLLYFYPKDDTPGCTKEACAFRDGYQALRARSVRVVGISLDDAASHRAFAKKYGLPFPLLSDRGGDVAASYGALRAWGPVRFAKRHSFLIDPAGRIRKIYRSVDAGAHYDEVLGDLDQIMREAAMK